MVKQTHEQKSPELAAADEIKLMLGELFGNVYYGGYPYADKIPDQETYLIHLHGSKLHVLRAWFPGIKSSAVYCGKTELPPRPFTPYIPTVAKLPEDANDEEKYRHRLAQDEYKLEIEQAAEQYRVELGGEPDLKTFRVFASREFDLWNFGDFKEATIHVASVLLHLMAGHSRMGILQRQFYLFESRMIWQRLKRMEEAASGAANTTNDLISGFDDSEDSGGEDPSSAHYEHVDRIDIPVSPPDAGLGLGYVETVAEEGSSCEEEENKENKGEEEEEEEEGQAITHSSTNVDIDGPSSLSPLRASVKNEAWWKDPRFCLSK